MIRRPTKRGVSLLATSALLGLALLGPGAAGAATPLAELTGWGPSPTTVSPGETVAFSVSLKNIDPSTISTLLLTTDPITLKGIATSDDGTCKNGTPFSCTFKQVKPGETVSAFVVLTAPSTGTGFDVRFVWSTVGDTGKDKPGTSHGDNFLWPELAPAHVTINDSTNFLGRWVATTNQLTVANDQAVSATNKQATKVVVPNTGIPASVEDGPDVVFDCDSELVDCTELYGETSIVVVATGDAYDVKIVITMDSSEIPNGINSNTLNIYHAWAGGEELISTRCTYAPGEDVPTNFPPACLTVKKLAGGDLEITIWTEHNGFIKGA